MPTGLGNTLHIPTIDEEPDLGEAYRELILDDVAVYSYPITGTDDGLSGFSLDPEGHLQWTSS